IVPPKPSSGFGGGLLTEEDKSERKTNPYLMNLAREHPENPVPLRGGLLGTPVNSGFVADERHRIDGKKRVMHEDWARIINKAPDFGGILPTFKYHVETNGDAGRVDVADMLWRAAQTNPTQAQSLQRELAGALGGETIPMRRALLVGEEVLKQNAYSRSLFEKAPYDFEQMRKSYWQSMETYKAEFAQKQQAAARTQAADNNSTEQNGTRENSLTYAPPLESKATSDGVSNTEEKTALYWYEKLLVPEHIEKNAKSVLGRATDDTFNEKEVNRMYEQVLDSLSLPEAKMFKDINPKSEKIVLSPEQYAIIKKHIDLLSPDLRDRAADALGRAIEGGRVIRKER
ncbi:MAG: hypothetical protein HQL45_17340, partial [Alphaproteobacteria bacterium]|nr:hypothetical protein [Alphaproteobacteria bacterium]